MEAVPKVYKLSVKETALIKIVDFIAEVCMWQLFNQSFSSVGLIPHGSVAVNGTLL
jgi:hypothetical protein